MVTETQDTIQESERSIQNAPSRLETLAFGALGAISGIALTGAFLYNPLSAAVGAVAAAGAGAAVGAVVGAAVGAAVGAGAAGAAVVGAAVGAGAAGAAGAAVVGAGATIYLSHKAHDVKRRLRNVLTGSALIASLATGAGYGISSYGHRINTVRQIQAGEEQGIMIETPRASSMYLLRDKTNYR